MQNIGIEKRRLDCHLSGDERTARAMKAAELSEKAGEEKAQAQRMKEEAGALLKQSEARALEAGKLLGYYKSGIEPRDVDCEVDFDPATSRVCVYRTDTVTLVETRRPDDADWKKINDRKQTSMDLRGGDRFSKVTQLREELEAEVDGLVDEVVETRAKQRKAAKTKPDGGVTLSVVKPEAAPAEQPAAQ